ncbi:MAG: DUF1800 domain-containing protein [Luteitalea sp.]
MRLPILTLGALALTVGLGAREGTRRSAALDDATAVHVLNRLTFGPTAASVRDLQAQGLSAWLDRQLRPEGIDDAQLEQRLAGMRTLAMSPQALAETIYLPALERRRARQQAGETDVPVERGMADGRRPEREVVLELTAQKLLRATASERQVEAVLVDFWFNHFNVFAGKGPVRQYVAAYERTAIQPHVLGSFRAMLGAVAGSPAMLFYLDNWQSSVEREAGATRPMGKARPAGLNENYARELLELHTLGVDGGYSQQDIGEVARAFTGWTIRAPRRGGDAFFDPRRHDAGARTVLGQAIPAGGGRAAGERVLDLLARHPATARHIATRLATRLVSDTPPEALVARVAQRFQQTNGDLRETVRALVLSPEFVAPAHRQSKVKTPFEFVTSALRALDADVRHAGALGGQLRTFGMAPYFAQPPTGFSDRSDAWTNGGALLQRMTLAVALTQGRVRGVAVPALPVVTPPGDADADRLAAARALGRALAFGDLSVKTLETVSRGRSTAEMAALVLGAPEFQRR